MKYPNKGIISTARKMIRRAWPMLSLYMEQFINEKHLGDGPVVGKPFCKEAWVEDRNCFKFQKRVKANLDKTKFLPDIVVTLEIYPYGMEANNEYLVQLPVFDKGDNDYLKEVTVLLPKENQ